MVEENRAGDNGPTQDGADDILSREVVIVARLEENGVAVRVISRAVSALDRLFGSLFDIPAAFAEGIADKKRLRDHIEKRRLLTLAEIAETKLRGLPNATDALLVDHMQDVARKQANSAGVAVEALEALKELPAPMEPGQREEEPPGAMPIDEDWMNQFARYAEDASSEKLQQIWGRVLAGELNQVGSFSRHTLRFIAELDKETAKNCQYAADRALGAIIPKSTDWSEEEGLMIGIDLQRLGLLDGVGGLGSKQTCVFVNEAHQVVFNGQHALVVHGEIGSEFSVEVIVLTRVGREVFSLLLPADETTALRSFADLAEGPKIKRIELGLFTRTSGGIRLSAKETIRDNSAT